MLVQKDLRKLFHQLLQNEIAEVELGGSRITIRFDPAESKFLLTTPVYSGGNFVPQSVRQCLNHKLPFAQEHLKTYLSLKEEQFEINLNYVGTLNNLTNEQFRDLLEDFTWLSDEWRAFLDDHDKNDIVHVRIPR